MMNQSTKQLLFYILTLINTSAFSLGLTATEINLPPNQTVILANTDTKSINILCAAHVASYAPQTISIKILSGRGIFNGTTFKQGDSITALISNTQQIPIVAVSRTSAQVINLGPYLMRAVC